MGLVCRGLGDSRMEIYGPSNGHYRIFIYDKDDKIDFIVKETGFNHLIDNLKRLREDGNRKI